MSARNSGSTTYPEICPRCGSGDFTTISCVSGPHRLETLCARCARHISWVPVPMIEERARRFTMPFGRYQGKTLDELAKRDPGYVRWVARNVDGPAGTAAQCLVRALDAEGPAR
jgi:uncharacterized protein (DUF3820 family)